MRKPSTPGGRGFTLVEIAVATAIVGIALAALLAAVGSNTRSNDAGAKLTPGVFLAQEIREWTLTLPFSDRDSGDADNPPGPDGTSPQVFVDDLDDFYGTDGLGTTYNPPRNGRGTAIPELAGWSQTITLTWRDPNDIATPVTAGTSDLISVQVGVAYQGKSVTGASWLVARKEQP